MGDRRWAIGPVTAVGLMASGGASRWLPPQRGLGTVDSLLDCVYDLQAQAVATDYLAAATQLSLRQPRRSLIMLITNVRDEDIEDLQSLGIEVKKIGRSNHESTAEKENSRSCQFVP